MSSYFSERLHIALRLVKESDSISRPSLSFCLSASRIAPSSALELEANLKPVFSSLIFMFLLLLSLYHTPIPADAFSHPFFIADPPVLIFVNRPDGSIHSFIFGSSLRGWNGSFFLDLCPSTFPSVLILPIIPCFGLVSGL